MVTREKTSSNKWHHENMQSWSNCELCIFYCTKKNTNIEEQHLGSFQVWWLTQQSWSEFTAGTRPETKSWKITTKTFANTVIILIIWISSVDLRANSILRFGFRQWSWVWMKQPETELWTRRSNCSFNFMFVPLVPLWFFCSAPRVVFRVILGECVIFIFPPWNNRKCDTG